jgi:hypothetical protein
MDYDRRRKQADVRLEQVLHKPAEADEALAKAYQALISFKQGFDSMHEIPKDFHGIYQQVMKAMDEVGAARKHTYQLREMAKRMPR